MNFLVGVTPYQWSLPAIGSGERPIAKTIDYTGRGVGLGLVIGAFDAWLIPPHVRRKSHMTSMKQGLLALRKHALWQGAAWGSFALTTELLALARGKDDWKNFAVGGGVAGHIYGRLFFKNSYHYTLFTLIGIGAASYFSLSDYILNPDHTWIRKDEPDPEGWTPGMGFVTNRMQKQYWLNKGRPW